MSWIDFSECKTIKEISDKLMPRCTGSESHVAMAQTFAQNILQKELISEQNKYQEKQLQKMEEQNNTTRKLVKATWTLVIVSLIVNLGLGITNIVLLFR